MKIYNQDKSQIITDYDETKGRLVEDTLTYIRPEIKEVAEQGHYEVIKEYPNGGKDVKWVVDIKGIKGSPKKEIEEQILVFVPYSSSELLEIELEQLRYKREIECFDIVNRGAVWYDTLTAEQKQELAEWYRAWLDVTETRKIPQRPSWLK